MKEKIKKRVLQMTADDDEIYAVRMASSMDGFTSITDYIRSLVTVDVVAKKKAHKHPEIFGMTTADYDQLSEAEREKYLNQIGPVKPASIDYYLRVKTGEVVVGGMKVRTENNELGL